MYFSVKLCEPTPLWFSSSCLDWFKNTCFYYLSKYQFAIFKVYKKCMSPSMEKTAHAPLEIDARNVKTNHDFLILNCSFFRALFLINFNYFYLKASCWLTRVEFIGKCKILSYRKYCIIKLLKLKYIWLEYLLCLKQ